MRQPTLFDGDRDADATSNRPPDQAARDFAVDPSNHVVLEASAGTGKTRVLVDRYVRLIEAGVDPRHILAITFTRKAAAEMRERVLAELRRRGDSGGFSADRWAAIRARLSHVEISTIDAFCFGLLREFPLEANVDPGFDIADETEMGRFANEALDLAFRVTRPLLASDEHLRLLFARVKQPVLREALATLLDRRHVAVPAIATFVDRRRGVGSAADVCDRFVARVRAACEPASALRALIDDGPAGAREFRPVAAALSGLADDHGDVAEIQTLRARLERYFLTKDGKPRQRLARPFQATHFASADGRRRHEQALAAASPRVKAALDAIDTDVNVLLARGLARMLAVTVTQYTRLLDEHALLDFAGMLERAVDLLERQEEFARSRLKLQSRYHHLLIDEFQDTSRRQWRLIDLLIDAWAEGEGSADAPTSIFIVGDRKQSIYRFRHAEVTLLDEAARRIGLLRPGSRVRHAITTSFRAVPELLAFVNAISRNLGGDPELPDRWRYDETDRFPVPVVEPGARRDGRPVLGLVAEPTLAAAAAAVAEKITRLLESAVVRDRSGGARPARPDDIAVLFRTRAGHQVFEEALEIRGVRTYVYKGLGFFDAPEVQDLQALIRFIAQPDSDLRAAELLRSRLVRLSDGGLLRLAPDFAGALLARSFDVAGAKLHELDAAFLARVRERLPAWLDLADRLPPSEALDVVLRESAYMSEMRGRRLDQARENVKKLRALVRRVENRGYTTFGRLAAYFETLRLGDDSNAIVEAAGAVNLMTIHAAKGLEFPIVFVVNLHSAGRGRPPGVSVIERGPAGEPEVSFGSSEATRLEEARETEELRRLLYVAVTRARDRLYLAVETDTKGQLRRPPRSLAALLPPSLAQLFTAPASDVTPPSEVVWTTDEGSFAFERCRAPDHAPAVPPSSDTDVAVPVVVSPLVAGVHVSAAVAPAVGGFAVSEDETARLQRVLPERSPHDERLLGTLVHRFLARGIAADTTDDPRVLVEQCLTAAERIDVVDPAGLGAAALRIYGGLRADPELSTVLASGECLYEVPFSLVSAASPDQVVRGVIDCLVLSAEAATVLEFKTGVPRAEHGPQAEVYRQAIAAILGNLQVNVRLCYPKS